MSFKQSSQTTENLVEKDDEGKQRQRESKVFRGVLEAKVAKSRLKIYNLSKWCLLLNEANRSVKKALGGWNSLFKDLCKGHLYQIQ